MGIVIYQKTQRATVILPAMVAGAVALAIGAVVATPAMWAAAAVLAVVALLFSSLTVRVDAASVRWHFGPGFWRKSVSLDAIERAEAVRNKWWYGWGIRHTPHGWLYNVSGLRAVELGLAGGRAVRLGSDEPEALLAAIEKAREARLSRR